MVIQPRLFTSHTSGEDWKVYRAIIHLPRDDAILVGPWETLISLSLFAQTPLMQFCSDYKVLLTSEHPLQRK